MRGLACLLLMATKEHLRHSDQEAVLSEVWPSVCKISLSKTLWTDVAIESVSASFQRINVRY